MNEMSEPILKEYDIESDVLGNTRKIWIQAPAQARRTPGLAVFLDGNYFAENFGAPETMAKLQRAGTLPPMWSVYVSGGERTVRWPESFCNDDFVSFICDELLRWLESKIGKTSQRLLAGVSLTGLSAAHLALSRPGVFERVLCLSGSFWWKEGLLASRVGEFPRADTAFRLTVGDQESATNVDHGHGLVQELSQIDGVEAMRLALEAHAFPLSFARFQGGHDAQSWRRELPGDLEALWRIGES